MFHIIFALGSECSREQKFQGTKVPGNESFWERQYSGAKVRGNESSSYRFGQTRVSWVLLQSENLNVDLTGNACCLVQFFYFNGIG